MDEWKHHYRSVFGNHSSSVSFCKQMPLYFVAMLFSSTGWKELLQPFFFLVFRISSWVYETFKRFMTCWTKFSVLGFIVVTDHELRCDVKVDVIDSIEIISRTRELYVDDSPLELMVRALDAEGKECQRIQQN